MFDRQQQERIGKALVTGFNRNKSPDLKQVGGISNAKTHAGVARMT